MFYIKTVMPYLRVDDKKIEYEWLGPAPAEAPTLVFLHEGLGSVAMWRDFPRRVVEATGWGALVYSRAGYGKSDSIELLRQVEAINNGCQGPVHKVILKDCGHSPHVDQPAETLEAIVKFVRSTAI
jgi:pimeloyl-ACP methyl ester carboxylesterase